MGKTIKRYPRTFFRSPRGQKQALTQEGIRAGAVPPNAYDDINFDRHVYTILRIARKLKDECFSYEDIVHKLVAKGYSKRDAEQAAKDACGMRFYRGFRIEQGQLKIGSITKVVKT